MVVLQNDVGNYYSPNITIVPLTSKDKKPDQPTHYELVNVRGLIPDQQRLGNALKQSPNSELSGIWEGLKKELKGVEEAVRVHLGFYVPDSIELP